MPSTKDYRHTNVCSLSSFSSSIYSNATVNPLQGIFTVLPVNHRGFQSDSNPIFAVNSAEPL